MLLFSRYWYIYVKYFLIMYSKHFSVFFFVSWNSAKSPSSASSQPEGCTKASIEPDRQHRLGIVSDHLYDSITDTSAHTYMALRQQ